MTDETKPNNMRIWKEVFEVDPKHTTPIKDGRNLTAIAPMSLIMQATKLWGPIGEGWGFEVLKDEIVNPDAKYASEMLHVMSIKLWWDGKRPNCVTFGFGCTKMYQMRGDKPYIDDDFNKSTLTDAITNALSRLGFGGSVRLGEMQSKYTTNLDAKDSELEKAWDEVVAWWKKANPNEDKSSGMLISEFVQDLEANSRSGTNVSHVRSLLK